MRKTKKKQYYDQSTHCLQCCDQLKIGLDIVYNVWIGHNIAPLFCKQNNDVTRFVKESLNNMVV